ncbi:MAG: MFS transporter [Lacisediminihabitans sp.]
MVSDGGRSLAGPLLGQLGASALLVGLVTGAGEAIAQAFRLVFGPWADRTRRYWTFSLVGYALTAVCIPLLALAPFVGSAGLLVASALILGDRTGKAVRSPAKTVLLADAAGAVGRGRGFAVHKSLDQLGAFLGPLLVSAVIAVTAVLWPAFAVLAVPAALAIGLLAWIRKRVPDTSVYERGHDAATPAQTTGSGPAATAIPTRLPSTFYPFAAAAFASNAGLVTFGVISFHLTDAGLVSLPAVPLVYAAAMAAAALAALTSGYVYDRWGTNVLLALPVLIALIPGLALSEQLAAVLVGVLSWGTAVGIQDSTVKALVADLVPPERRGTAYGIFAAFEGAGALVGGALAGSLYDRRPLLVVVVVVLQTIALILLIVTVRRQRKDDLRAAK